MNSIQHAPDTMIEGLSNEEYHAHPAVSASTLKRILFNDETYEVANNIPVEATPFMEFGTLVHCLILEPHKFPDEYIVMPKVDLRTKDGKAVKAEYEENAQGKNIITEADYERALNCVKAFNEDGVKRLIDGGENEQRFLGVVKDIPLYDENGKEIIGLYDIDTRGMIDNINRPKSIITDLKVTQNFGRAFNRECGDRGHGMQLALYDDLSGGVRQRAIIGIQSHPPHKITIVEVSDAEKETGRDFYRTGIELWLDIKTYPHKYNSRLCFNREDNSVVFQLETPYWQHLMIDKIKKRRGY